MQSTTDLTPNVVNTSVGQEMAPILREEIQDAQYIPSLKISVITICFNCKDFLRETLESVVNQSYQDLEYIVVDGASTDGSIDVINKYRDRITTIVSEPDEGIYDAMNKGLKLATGEWILFMNAGDVFYSQDTISKVFAKSYDDNIKIVYGDCYIRFHDSLQRYDYCFLSGIKIGMPFSHQSMFAHRSVLQQFDNRYKIAADYHFLLKLWSEKGPSVFKYCEEPVCIIDTTGVSMNDKTRKVTTYETLLVRSKYKDFRFWRSLIRHIIDYGFSDVIKILTWKF